MGVMKGPGAYLLVTPMRNEVPMLSGLFQSVLCQTARPRKWLIVDDGSEDNSLNTAKILASDNDWIVVVKRISTSKADWINIGRVISYGVALGLDLCGKNGDIPAMVGVLDADTILAPNYFEILINELESDSDAVIATGLVSETGESPKSRGLPRGCARLYKTSFLKELGGFSQYPSPETILEIKARKRNYDVLVVQAAEGFHRRVSSNSGSPEGLRALGLSHYYLGFDLASFMMSVVLLVISRGPTKAAAFFGGYVEGVAGRFRKIDDDEIRGHYSMAWRRALYNPESLRAIRDFLRRRSM